MTDIVDVPPSVTDWSNDWDWLDDDWGVRAPEIWSELRDAGVAMAFTERYGRAFMPITHEGVSEIAHNTDDFSSFRVSVAMPDSPVRKASPITSDPPDHHGHRRLLLPAFAPKAVARKEDEMRRYCRELIAAIEGQDTADAAVDYARHLPVHVIAEMIGVPEADADLFRDWVYRNFQLAPRDSQIKLDLMTEMDEYFWALLESRRADPLEDLASLVALAELDGEPLDREMQVGFLVLQILAGIDTTWSALGSGLWHFAQQPDQVARLAAAADDDPLWMMAVEEVLRFYAPVTMARQVISDTEVSGCPMHAGDQVLLTFPAANRDPEAFERPDEFILDRAANRHSAFGLGIHRCIGSNLARLELLTGIQEWVRAFPTYRLDTHRETTWVNGQVRGPRNVPVHLRSS